MKGSIRRIVSGLIVLSALAAGGCTEMEIPETPAEDTEQPSQDLPPTIITVGLPGTDADTKLTYEEITYNGRKALKTLWCDGDALTANASPSSRNDTYTFSIIGGQGTRSGVFECTEYKNGYRPQNFSTNAWTMYFPGKIENDPDYLTFSYAGQVQTGNDNMDHLKDFHTIRLTLYDGTDTRIPFDDRYIDFSGEDLNQSGCMKFNLSGLPAGTVPTKISLRYRNSSYGSSVFYEHNTLPRFFGSVYPDYTTTSTLSMDLSGFGETTSVTAYMMLSNADVELRAGGTLKVTVSTSEGKRYFCEKPVNADATLKGGYFNTITCTSWTESNNIDGFDNPGEGIAVLQEASVGNGTDIVIMGDGFAADQFGKGGNYETIMKKAYEDFFSVEPYKTLKPYFNVYYINAESKQNHDAKPHFDEYGNQNGAIQGTASTVFSTQLKPASTNIRGDIGTVLEYAAQAIRIKGGKGGTPVTDENEIYNRAYKGLAMVMVNVACHAGTCSLSWSENEANDFGNSYSVAYTALGNDPEERRWTTIHEAGGHGFGKLADEYGGNIFTSFSTGIWNELKSIHSYGVDRNINEYYSESSRWKINGYPYTTASSLYWSELLDESYGYTVSEGLGMYEGANTYDELYCRSTENSIMRNQYGKNGQFFNAISRWAIWYRLMRLTGGTSAAQFKESLDEFISFDSTLDIKVNEIATKSSENYVERRFTPSSPPEKIRGRWENGRFIRIE